MELRHLQGRIPPSYLVIGAMYEGKPAGLAIAGYALGSSKHPYAKLLAVHVAAPLRRKRIGAGLIEQLDSMLIKAGIKHLSTEYLGGTAPVSAESAFFEHCGFQSPLPGIYVCSCSLQSVHRIPWITNMKLPETFEYDPLHTLSEKERKWIEDGRGVWYPPILDPFAEEDCIDMERSVVLRRGSNVIGWLILEHFDAKTILYKTMFVSKPYQRMARGIALIAEISRKMAQDPKYKEAVFFIEAENLPMTEFLKKNVALSLLKQEILWRTYKKL
ncbi:GNAT family N-acetyltransferase [Neobacillus mesonae]|nr:GNAT family N-acetyltransferase [Neobacillus mesonae]